MLRAWEWITTNADTEGLAKTNASSLCDSLICQSTGPGHNAYNRVKAKIELTGEGTNQCCRVCEYVQAGCPFCNQED